MRTLVKKPASSLDYRVSVSLSEDQHEFLSALAERKRVSLAWVVRDAVEKLIAQETPLFSRESAAERSV